MKQIPLTQGNFALVDADDYDRLMQWKWYFDNGYARRNKYIDGKPIAVLMHSFIVQTPRGMDTDHINGDKLDNRKENLRICSHIKNGYNRKNQINKRGKYKGVSWHTKSNMWRVRIGYDRKTISLGYFNSDIEAAKTYDEAAKVYHGAYARVNFS